MASVLIKRGNVDTPIDTRHVQAQKGNHVKTQQEGSHPQHREEA